MKIKPIEVLINLPTHFDFDSEDEAAQMVSNLNSFLAGKKRAKYEVVGSRADKIVVMFYLERNRDFSEMRDFILKYICDQDVMPEMELP